MRLFLTFLTFAIFICSSDARTTMEPPYRVRDQTIEFAENIHHTLRKQSVSAAQLQLERHDEIALALKRVSDTADAPEWTKAEGLYTLTFNDETNVFRLEFTGGTSLGRFAEFERLFGPIYSRVCIDAEMAAVEALQKEAERLHNQLAEEKSPVRRKLLEPLLDEKIRLMRSI